MVQVAHQMEMSMARREFPDPSLPVSNDELRYSGFTYGEQTEIRRRRKQWLADNKEAVEAEKLKHARTCQICQRPIFAETGVIAHHGYTRPFEGYQTASCYGARYLPLEKSRSRLGEWISYVSHVRDQLIELAAEIRAGKTEVPISYIKEQRGPRGKIVKVQKTFWAKNAEEYDWAYACLLAKTKTYYYMKPADLVSFDLARETYARKQEQDAFGWEQERKAQQARYDAWVQTEE
jgi:hypothetical protein